MKKMVLVFVALWLLCCMATGFAEESVQEESIQEVLQEEIELEDRQEDRRLEEIRQMIILSGTVVAGQTVAVSAPFGGTVEDFTVRKGDIVSAGEKLFSLKTTKVYAPCDGIVGDVRAQVGDEATFIQERYGALCYIEPLSRLLIKTDTKYAYSADENKQIHVGETVYIGSRTNNERVGIGFITSVDENGYTVEVTEGNLIFEDPVSIFRKRDFVPESKIGSGTTTLNPNVAITSEGTIFSLYATQGKEVKRGELLMETVGGSTSYNPLPTNQVLAGAKAVVASVDVTAGANVTKNQVMATLYPVEQFQISVNALEMDLVNLKVGDSVRIELANIYEKESMVGVVSSIAGQSASEATDTEYTVYIDFKANDFIRLGMSVNVYFNE